VVFFICTDCEQRHGTRVRQNRALLHLYLALLCIEARVIRAGSQSCIKHSTRNQNISLHTHSCALVAAKGDFFFYSFFMQLK
jgi:hypothetical protein